MKKEMVGEVPGNVLGMFADLAHKLQHGTILPLELGLFLKRENPFQAVADVSQMLTTHYSFYHHFFNLDMDFSSVRIPTRQSGFDRLIVVAQGLTPNKVYEVCQKHFKCWRYTDDLDADMDWGKEERNPKDGPYAIWVRDRQEADEELQNLSANDIKERGLTTETLAERLLHGLMCWSETKDHIDKDNITLCSGSRYQDGYVPYVVWYGLYGKMYIGWYDPRIAYDDLRPRVVVS